MAKDYFQDIVPQPHHGKKSIPVRHVEPEEESATDDEVEIGGSDRSIRNVNITPSRPRRSNSEAQPPAHAGRKKHGKRRWLWIIAGACVLVLAVFLLLALRPTTVTVTPRTHKVIFDETSQYVAYPAENVPAGALPYTLKTVDLEDSDVISSAGVVHAEDKASGQVTVYNNFSSAPITLIKNTRFATPDGLVFRAPADIVVPGKSGTTAGKIVVTVVADKAGAEYNVGPVSRLSLPGLKSSADEYTKVYAQSTAAFTGGLVGDKPGVSEADTERAVAGIRSRLETKARDAALALATDDAVVFTDLVQITYQDLPTTPESGQQVRVHEQAHILIPVFSAGEFAQSVARSVSSDSDDAKMTIVPGEGYGAHLLSDPAGLGVQPLQFALIGNATILWKIDAAGLAKALAGRDQGAFQTVVTGFQGIQEAHARIEPFWSNLFPKDAASIKIKVVNPVK